MSDLMPNDDISGRVCKVVSKQDIHGADIKPSHNLSDDIGFDSLDNIELLMAIEEEFEKEISDGQWLEVRTVQDIINLMEEIINGKVST